MKNYRMMAYTMHDELVESSVPIAFKLVNISIKHHNVPLKARFSRETIVTRMTVHHYETVARSIGILDQH